MARTPNASRDNDNIRIRDENEQLRVLLESALEDNASLVEERDNLRERARELAQELRLSDAAISQYEKRSNWLEPAYAAKSGTEEELEVANTSLHQTNQELDIRVEERTVQLREISDALRATEASLRAVADLVPDLLWRADSNGQADWFNQRWRVYAGQDHVSLSGMGWLDAIHVRDRAIARRSWNTAVRRGQAFEHEHRIRSVDGDYRWFMIRAKPSYGPDGRIVHWFVAGTDIHEKRCAIEALQQSETRFRTLIEGVPQLVWRSRSGGNWTWSNPQWNEYTGQDEAAASGMGWLDAFHPDHRQAALDAWERADDNSFLEIEGRIYHAGENRYRHFRTRALPVRDAADRIMEWLGTSTDVDDIVQLQEQQAILVGELQHRTRNLMAIVQAVTARTVRGTTSLEQFRTCIDDRFAALARVQGLLSQRDTGARIPFDVLLREEISAHVDIEQRNDKVVLNGPQGVPLRSSTVQTFALALHELATNAVKYGALSQNRGRLQIHWGVRRDDARGAQLWVDWRETGVSNMPTTGADARGGGYGRELIERALPYQLGAHTTYGFESDGVHCTIEMAVPDAPDFLEIHNG